MELSTFDPKKVNISLSETAIKHIEKELIKDPSKSGLRLFLQTSGCSGFMYETSLCDAPEKNDRKFKITDNLSKYVPNKDIPVLNGTVIDFVTVGLNSMLQFKNPNVTAECGCGESFSVTEE